MTEKLKKIEVVDSQGAGRCAGGQYGLEALIKSCESISFQRAGIYPPDSGREDIHPVVVDSLEKRFGKRVGDRRIYRLTPSDIDDRTLVLCLTDPKDLPTFVLKQAQNVLLAPVADPFPHLQDWEQAMTQIMGYALIIDHLLRNDCLPPAQRDDHGLIVPRELSPFCPSRWDPESYLHFQISYQSTFLMDFMQPGVEMTTRLYQQEIAVEAFLMTNGVNIHHGQRITSKI